MSYNNNPYGHFPHTAHQPQQQHQHSSASASTSGPRAKCDQVVYEALCKACEIIVGSRATVGSTNSNNNHSTARFNLHVPEVAGVRSILSNYRLQLHELPVRLDVYYQHESESGQDGPPRRELLERWCLEYKSIIGNNNGDSPSNRQQHSPLHTGNNDPMMVQLTQVCKRIVVWLRTLYCWTRLLPAKQLGNTSKVGFSIYVHADGSDDVTELTARQGFLLGGYGSSGSSSLTQQPPYYARSGGVSNSSKNGVVVTPYGELSWQVAYSPPSKVERLVPVRTPAVRIQIPNESMTQQNYHHHSSSSRPIPMAAAPHSGYYDNNHNKHQFAPHSAPLQAGARALTYTERSQQKQLEAAQRQRSNNNSHYHHLQSGKSFDPSGLLYRSSSPGSNNHQQHHPLKNHHQHPPSGVSSAALHAHHQRQQSSPSRTPPTHSSSENPPNRVMSGLSLALLMASNEDDVNDDPSSPTDRPSNRNDDDDNASHNNSNDVSPDDSAVVVHTDDGEEETAEEVKRRAALHQVPPHYLLEQQSQQSQQQSSTGDYGYGYNNHIPWQKIHPSLSNPAPQSSFNRQGSFGRTLSSSPAGSVTSASRAPPTPPVPAFCGTPTTTPNLAYFIPPRNRSDSFGNSNKSTTTSTAVTPPFPSRPAGFLQEAPSLQLEPPQIPSVPVSGSNAAPETPTTPAIAAKTPMTSLDLLRSSPFQQQHQHSLHSSPWAAAADARGDSMLSSLSFAPDTYHSGSDHRLTNSGAELRRSLWSGGGLASGSMLPSSAYHHHYYQQQHPLDTAAQGDDFLLGEEMPFAVELPVAPSTSTNTNGDGKLTKSGAAAGASTGSSSSYLGNSAALASLAQKCAAPSHRLKLFEKKAPAAAASSSNQDSSATANAAQQPVDLVSSLADQLQEFRTFGASLQVEAATESLSGSGSSTNPNPISLRS